MLKSKNSHKVALPGARLVLLVGKSSEPSVPLAKRVTLTGAGPGVHLCLHTPGVDEIHALILNADRGVFLRDLASRGGTAVNGVKVKQAMLRDGDRIRMGQIEMLFEAGPAPTDGDAAIEPEAAALRFAGAVHRLRGPVVLIGNDARCDLRLADQDCAQKHAMIVAVNGRWQFRALKLGPLTQLNGQVVRRERLSDGARLLIGHTELHFTRSAPAEDALALPLARAEVPSHAPAPPTPPQPKPEPMPPALDEVPVASERVEEAEPVIDTPDATVELPAQQPTSIPTAPPLPSNPESDLKDDLMDGDAPAGFDGSFSDADRVIITTGEAPNMELVRSWGPLAQAMAASQAPEPDAVAGEDSATPDSAGRFNARWLVGAVLCAAVLIAFVVWGVFTLNR